MPPYVTLPLPFAMHRGFTAGLPSYSAGSFPLGSAPMRAYVTSVAVAANVVTLGVRMIEGIIPSVGNLVTVLGTIAGGPTVNVTNVAITGVSITPATGLGTITYAATAANLATTPDGGEVQVLATDVAETLAVQKYQQFALEPMGGYGITMVWATPSAPATLALQLEGAVNDTDAEYSIIGVAQTTLSGTLIATVPQNVRFVRPNVTAFTGGVSPTLVVKLLQSMMSAS
jgi:hypothetical protein